MDNPIVQSVLMIAVLGVVFYFFLIRPENKKKKQHKALLESMSVGDDIVTIGGITGKIVSTKDDFVVFETGADRVRIKIIKAAVSTVTKEKTSEPEETE